MAGMLEPWLADVGKELLEGSRDIWGKLRALWIVGTLLCRGPTTEP